MKEYAAIIEREADGRYSVYVPDLPGCASMGIHAVGARERREAIACYVEGHQKLGRAIPRRRARVEVVRIHGGVTSSRRSAGRASRRRSNAPASARCIAKGSHMMLVHGTDPARIAVVPLHMGKVLPPGTLRAILKGARLSIEELRRLL